MNLLLHGIGRAGGALVDVADALADQEWPPHRRAARSALWRRRTVRRQ